jgi:hypothetical protein
MASIGMANVAMASAINRPRSMMNDAENQKQVKIGVEQGVNDVYGQDKFFLKTAGVDTKEWGLMKGLNAKQVLQYMKHDSLDVGLKPEIIENLKSNNHMKFLGELDNLMKLTKINQALPDEKVEGLLARLVKGALKVQADKIVLK